MITEPQNSTYALIATLPKSGTWYCQCLFWSYAILRKHTALYLEKGGFELNLFTFLKERKIGGVWSHLDTRSLLGLEGFYIGHIICPGFEEKHNELENRWRDLMFSVPGYNWGEIVLKKQQKWHNFNPLNNPDARIIYLYRNPLDHLVSYFQHTQYHIDDNERYLTNTDGALIPVENISDFTFKAGRLDSFIKHYYTFKIMKKVAPESIMLIPYEKLIADPINIFSSIFNFFGVTLDDPLHWQFFLEALKASSMESLAAIEKKMGGALNHEQRPGGKHINGGQVGKWQEHFSSKTISQIESRLNEFDIGLDEFILKAV